MMKPRVMIADDDATFRRLIAQLLRKRYLVLPAVDGHDAFEKAQEVRPDLILLDLSMPGQNGLETLEQIRETSELATVPVIVVTADSRRETVVAMAQAGANDYMLKTSVTRESRRFLDRIGSAIEDSNTVLMR